MSVAHNWWLGDGALPRSAGHPQMPGALLPPSPAPPARIEWMREPARLRPAAPIRTPCPALRLAEGMIRAGICLALMLAGAVIGMVLIGVAHAMAGVIA